MEFLLRQSHILKSITAFQFHFRCFSDSLLHNVACCGNIVILLGAHPRSEDVLWSIHIMVKIFPPFSVLGLLLSLPSPIYPCTTLSSSHDCCFILLTHFMIPCHGRSVVDTRWITGADLGFIKGGGGGGGGGGLTQGTNLLARGVRSILPSMRNMLELGGSGGMPPPPGKF